MKKIPTLFVRQFENHKVVKCINEVTEGLEWVLKDPEVIPTIKYDGSCCMINSDGVFFRRYDAKSAGRGNARGDNVRLLQLQLDGAIPCQPNPDPVTGHWPHWMPVSKDSPADKWFVEAYRNTKCISTEGIKWFMEVYWNTKTFCIPICISIAPGTYEAIGVHFQGNPYDLRNDYLVKHGEIPIYGLEMTYDGIKRWLAEHNEEGIVFWHHGEPICKVKRSDFGFEWPVDNKKEGE